MKFIVGLGNPDKEYEKTRHNIGFRVLAGMPVAMEIKSGTWKYKKEFQAEVLSIESVLLVRPRTYVNLTGDSVSAIRYHYEASPSDFLFVCDDVNLMFGKLRLRDSGSAGGHHGLDSIIQSIGDGNFARLRIGVGNEDMPKDDLTEFVLGNFNRQEEKQINNILGNAISICKTWIEKGFQPAMARLSQLQSIIVKGE